MSNHVSPWFIRFLQDYPAEPIVNPYGAPGERVYKENDVEMIVEIGQIVHYVLESYEPALCRPAIVVRTWNKPSRLSDPVQLQVFMDGTNDASVRYDDMPPMQWKTSRIYSSTRERGTWHFGYDCA